MKLPSTNLSRGKSSQRVTWSEPAPSISQSCPKDPRRNRCEDALESVRHTTQGSQKASARARGPGQPLRFSDRLFAYFHCTKLNQVQEIGDSANGLENEELDEAKCFRGMSGTESWFPELFSAGRCEIVQSLEPCQGDSALTVECGGDSPSWAACGAESQSQKRVWRTRSSKSTAGIEAWPVAEVECASQLWRVGWKWRDKACPLAFFL